LTEKSELKCPRCGGKLKLDASKFPSMNTFILAPPPQLQISILYCEKCGEAVRLSPTNLASKYKLKAEKSLCHSCAYAIK